LPSKSILKSVKYDGDDALNDVIADIVVSIEPHFTIDVLLSVR
jgi:hypothetical protein